ncbi:carbohydrate ABC transporter substrate-binding protein, CUT1 family [Actinacidiphila yanglinensis]|uniref:Carbohydrate ABC transporter substrate-binding protein, CUT1 family n=1 Tax=Actinacidiphila yanglinensis TaxID=310779 RepID=A0A1H6EEE3_9ACTN|nr:ABC transporter substrate-binding protein [Actinacidiphila yanglinensis]SEG95165.1 carbohydrate ABC transporter substrate-binding protein, CUT1 family [Actinacidiphila yanglinensis]
MSHARTPLARRSVLAAGAAAAASSALAACSGSSSKGPGGTVNLTYQYMSFLAQPDQALVQKALDARLKALGATFTVTLQPVLDYTEKMTLNMSAGNVADLVFTASWTNDFFKNAGSGNFLALDDLLPQHAPKLYASLPKSIWQGATVGGKIYAAINQQRFPKLWGVSLRRDLAEKYDLDVASLTGYAQLEPFFAKVRAGEKDVICWATDNATSGTAFYPELYGWDPVATQYGLAVKYDDTSRKVFNVYATDEYRAAAELVYSWRQKGYTTKDPLSAADRAAKQHAGSIAAFSTQAPPTNPQLESFPTLSKSFVATPLLNTDGVASTLTAVSRDTAHAEECVRFLELINTDKVLYNLLCFGIEGKHYVLKDGVATFPPGVDTKSDRYNPNLDWQYGDQFNAFYRTADDAKSKRWEVEAALNKSAATSVALGFALDTSKLRTQVATVTAAITQYQQQVTIGLVKPSDGIPKLLKQLDRAGLDTLLSATQDQMDTWAKGK